jgi:DNA repair protein RadC
MSTATQLELGRTYSIPVVRVQLVRDRALRHHAKQIRSPSDAAALVREYLAGADREHFVVLCLDSQHKVTGIHTVSIGGLANAPVHPREVFKVAILSTAAAVILAHNHPSGNPEPSRDDILITEQLRAAGRLLGIEVLDHVIVTEDGDFVSLRERRQGFA